MLLVNIESDDINNYFDFYISYFITTLNKVVNTASAIHIIISVINNIII